MSLYVLEIHLDLPSFRIGSVIMIHMAHCSNPDPVRTYFSSLLNMRSSHPKHEFRDCYGVPMIKDPSQKI